MNNYKIWDILKAKIYYQDTKAYNINIFNDIINKLEKRIDDNL